MPARHARATFLALMFVAANATLGCGSEQARPKTAAAPRAASAKPQASPTTPSPPAPARPADAGDAAAYYRQHRAELEQADATAAASIDFARLRRGRLYAGEPGISNELMAELRAALDHPKPAQLLDIAGRMLALDPTDLRAHLVLASAFRDTGQTAQADAHVVIAKALLESIAHTGDGRSFATAWVVYQVKEEYEFLEVLGVAVGGQLLEQQGERAFDVLGVKNPDSGSQGKAYFDVTELFAEEGRAASAGSAQD